MQPAQVMSALFAQQQAAPLHLHKLNPQAALRADEEAAQAEAGIVMRQPSMAVRLQSLQARGLRRAAW
jgi:hypothetical protein